MEPLGGGKFDLVNRVIADIENVNRWMFYEYITYNNKNIIYARVTFFL